MGMAFGLARRLDVLVLVRQAARRQWKLLADIEALKDTGFSSSSRAGVNQACPARRCCASATYTCAQANTDPACRAGRAGSHGSDIDETYFHHHNMQLDLYAATRHHASVSSTSSQELDSARSRSGLFFARFSPIFLAATHRTLACHPGIVLLLCMLNCGVPRIRLPRC